MKATGASMGYRIPTNPNSGVVSIPAQPVDTFDIPPLAPPEVQAADDNFQRLADEYRQLQSQLSKALRLRDHEIGQAHAAATKARVEHAKAPAKLPSQVEAEYDAKLDALRSELSILADAVDQAGNNLVATIGANKDEWLVALDAADEQATVELAKAVKMVEAALDVLAYARSAPRWLREDFSSTRPYGGGDSLGRSSTAVHHLDEVVNGRKQLVGYKDGGPIFEQVGGPSAKEGAKS